MIRVLLIAVVLITGVIFTGTVGLGHSSAVDTQINNPISVLVDLKLDKSAQDAYVAAHDGVIEHRYNITTAIDIKLPLDQFPAFSANSVVGEVSLDSQVQAIDTELDNSWGVKLIGGGTNQAAGFTGLGVRIGILDTGINTTHQDLVDRYDPSCSYDFVNSDANPADDNGHGSHVSGIAAASDNNLGVVGVAPSARLCAYKVLDGAGNGGWGNIIAALDRAVTDHVQVINMSFGSVGDPGIFVSDAITAAYNANLTLVAAAGNNGNCATADNPDSVLWPAQYLSVIAVAATSAVDVRPCWSSAGPKVEIAAPGVRVTSDYIGSTTAYASFSGTSMASPHVAGLIAELLGCAPGATQAQIRNAIDNTALDLGTPGRDIFTGFGRVRAVNAAAAIGCVGAPVPTPTSTNIPNTNTRTAIPNTPTATPIRTVTATRTRTPIITLTPTPATPSATRTPTITPGGPTATKTPCITYCPCPSDPQYFCTATPSGGSPVPTNSPLPTFTVLPPTSTQTPTPRPTVCS